MDAGVAKEETAANLDAEMVSDTPPLLHISTPPGRITSLQVTCPLPLLQQLNRSDLLWSPFEVSTFTV